MYLENMQERCSMILKSFELLKKILRDRAVCLDNSITIFDQVSEKPFIVKILKKEKKIQFFSDDEEIALITPDNSVVDEEYEEVVEEWLNALTSLGFKRYIPKL